MTDLVVIVPSRGRPKAAAEVAEAFQGTCTADTSLVFAVDLDDPVFDEYLLAAPELETRLLPASNASMVEALNKAAVHYAKDCFAVGFMGDDHRPRTQGWDKHYLDALHELGTGLVYGNDLLQGERIPTQVAITSDIIRTLGYMAPPQLHHMYVDNAWLALGQALGRITYLPDVIVEHLHPVAGKAEWDEGYARVNHPGVYSRDEAHFRLWYGLGLVAVLPKLRKLVDA